MPVTAMDFLSLFKPSVEKQIQRARKKVKQPHGDPATRINAGRRLLDIGSDEALLALLERFTITASPSRQDEEEKIEVLNWIVGLGERAVPPLIRFLKRERQVYWPFRALQSIQPPDILALTMEEILRSQWDIPPASSDPIAQMIRMVEGLYTPELHSTVALYLGHENDDVRLAALDYLFNRPEEEVREPILECYLNSEDRPRIRGHILNRLVEAEWSVRGFRPRIEESLPEGYVLTRDGTVKVMGRKPLL
jgi:HEAT repeat protein